MYDVPHEMIVNAEFLKMGAYRIFLILLLLCLLEPSVLGEDLEETTKAFSEKFSRSGIFYSFIHAILELCFLTSPYISYIYDFQFKAVV